MVEYSKVNVKLSDPQLKNNICCQKLDRSDAKNEHKDV